ncbi:hypothetical protein DIPPA_05397 [Diplonema papillatum]|nr:hypothetical protein DIPPA_05397 [Diplonema papillatum]
MSFRHSNSLVKAFREGLKAQDAQRRVANTIVRGRAKGCAVKYTGTGRVEDIVLTEDGEFRDAAGFIDYDKVTSAVKLAVLDAQQKMASVKQAEWSEINPRIVTQHVQKPELLGPHPHNHFEYQAGNQRLASFPKGLTQAQVDMAGLSLEEAIEKRSGVQLAMENAFWTAGASIEKQTSLIAARTPST